MATPRIYTPEPLSANTTFCLDEAASKHLLRVLRHKPGDSLILFNGQEGGGEYHATILDAPGKRATLSVGEFIDRDPESSLQLTIAPVLLGGSRMDLIIQKSVELGVTALTPIISERAEAKIPADRLASRLEHWQKVIINASEQCGRTKLTHIQPPQEIGEWLHNDNSEVRLAGDPQGQPFNAVVTSATRSVAMLIGPEGGWSPQELEQLKQHAVQSVCFGPRILRAETAAIAAATLIQAVAGDLR